jgi:thioredoxin 1
MASAPAVDQGNFTQEVLQSELPVLVDFTAAWCPPCRALKPLLAGLASDYAGRLKVVELDVDANQGLAGAWGVQSMPTLLLFKKGAVAAGVVGFRPRSELEKLVEGALTAR